jgi:phage tail-like protein
MPAPQPFLQCHFQVDLGGGSLTGFASVSGLSAHLNVLEYREGADKFPSHRSYPGLAGYSQVTLTRALTKDLALWQWFQGKEPRDVVITLLDDAMQPGLRFLLRRAWPCRWEVPGLDAESSSPATESLELVHEGFTVESL